ncbi:ATP-utilizing enzyme of the PP-loop superfamily [Candidatus Syntrophocurvum alkaliphilum]|uniref:ATP-utilizing enzyme of the PP-loop superfamily n=1 Tax=Candidatus Syntrophocurvum alkaliphilum TaxID=2293317 RepID=A0A6I6DKS1_9FIRM|nr:ATP-dependent sacrificial sulfur transferase LarE [Candidatus Syntrophocurvum alkaliphilum]QGT99871.1 ATP-utilizing enzyme of the PP-loop superfamily [Candidatus Syntrophocurvum alkaliphilum]
MPKKTGKLEKLSNLKKIVQKLDSVILAYSGGLDSSFLLWVLSQEIKKDNLIAITCYSAITPSVEIKTAHKMTKYLGVNHFLVETPEIDCEDFMKNDLLRCYYCKRERFAFLYSLETHLDNPIILEGSQIDDLNDYRPGMKAIKEFNIKSPLIAADLNKNDIREISKVEGLPFANLETESCLATRIKTGQKIEINLLKKIEAAEQYIKELGINFIRVRINGDEARLELKPWDIDKAFLRRKKIIERLSVIGFEKISLDLYGYQE